MVKRRVLRDWVKTLAFVIFFLTMLFAVFYGLPLMYGHAGGRP